MTFDNYANMREKRNENFKTSIYRIYPRSIEYIITAVIYLPLLLFSFEFEAGEYFFSFFSFSSKTV